MDKNRSWRRTEETEIDLSDLLHRLLGQWKRMAACALAMAVLAGGYSYLTGAGTGAGDYDAEADGSIAAGDPAKSGTDQRAKTEEEQDQELADARRLAEEIGVLEEYLENSVLMQINANHKNRAVLLYSIEGAAEQSIPKIARSYLSFLENGGAVDAVRKTGSEWENLGSSYLAELITARQEEICTSQIVPEKSAGSGLGIFLYVEITGKDSAMVQKLAQSVQAVLESYSQAVKDTCGRHEISFVSSVAGEKIDPALLGQQREKRSALSASQASLKAMLDGFSEEQMALYQTQRHAGTSQKTGAQETASTDGQADSRSQAGTGKEPEDQNTADTNQQARAQETADASQQPGAQDTADASQQPGDPGLGDEGPGRSISMMYVILGFFAGIFVYAIIYAAWYILRDTLKSGKEFKLHYTIPLYGCVPLGKTSMASMPDARTGTADAQMARILNRVRLACRKQGVAKIFLAAEFTADEGAKGCLERMAMQLREWGIEALPAENAASDSSVWDALSESGVLLMVCRIDTTTYQAVDDAMGFYLENGIEVLGAAILG